MRELVLALLLVSGPLKAHLLLMGLSIPDVTVLAALGCAFFLFLDLVKHRFTLSLDTTSKSFLIILVSFVLLTGVSGIWSLSPSFWFVKWLLFFLPILACLYPILLHGFSLEKFFRSLILLSFLTCLMFAYYFPQWRLGLLNNSGLDIESYKTIYLGVGGIAGINLLVLFGYPRLFRFPLRLFFYGYFLIILFMASARGAVVFTVLCGSFIGCYKLANVLINKKMSKEALYVPLVLIVIFASSLMLKDGLSENIGKLAEHSVNRLSLLFADKKGASISSRFEHIELSTKMIEDDPIIGLGMASYGIVRIGEDTLDHPHNIFLEAWFEQGILGLILLISLLLITVVSSIQKNRIEVLACILFQIGLSMTSFSYSENRIMFAFLGLAIASYAYSASNKDVIKSV